MWPLTARTGSPVYLGVGCFGIIRSVDQVEQGCLVPRKMAGCCQRTRLKAKSAKDQVPLTSVKSVNQKVPEREILPPNPVSFLTFVEDWWNIEQFVSKCCATLNYLLDLTKLFVKILLTLFQRLTATIFLSEITTVHVLIGIFGTHNST